MSVKWTIVGKKFEGKWYCSADLGDEWVDFPMDHEDALWLGRFIKHAALIELEKGLFAEPGMHSVFCKVCT